jgi:hypothetical protein
MTAFGIVGIIAFGVLGYLDGPDFQMVVLMPRCTLRHWRR